MGRDTGNDYLADVGLMTFFSAKNYGAALQSLALQYTIEKKGYSVLFLNWHDALEKGSPNVSNFQKIKVFANDYKLSVKRYLGVLNIVEKTTNMFERFKMTFLHIDKTPLYDRDDLYGVADLYKGFIAGSDMVWTDIGQDMWAYFLQFAPKNKRGSYSPSLTGIATLSNEKRLQLVGYIKEIKFLSFREKEGYEFAINNCNRENNLTVDPTLLLKKDEWRKALGLIKDTVKKPYILIYMFGGVPSKVLSKVKEIAIEKKLFIRYIPMKPSEYLAEQKEGFSGAYGPSEFVDLFFNASFVVTNSYHGFLFSLISNIPFVVLARERSNKWKANEERIVSLLSMIDEKERFVNDYRDINSSLFDIDYIKINRMIDKLVAKSMCYLDEELLSFSKNQMDKKTTEYKNVALLSRKECYSCGSCMDACKVGAINMKEDEEGFKYPFIAEEKCIECGFCVKKCWAIQNVKKNKPINSYLGYYDSAKAQKSSSGGIFYAIAEEVIKYGGYVAGAALVNNMCNHIIVSNQDKLYLLQGSKYVKSELGNIYSDVKVLLDSQKVVLFSGMPCQISGLYSFLGREYKNLLTIDLICHGVPNGKLWNSYVDYLSGDGEITDISFRNKDNEKYKRSVFQLKYRHNGKEVIKEAYNSGYYSLYVKNATFQTSCYYCKFSGTERIGDITLGDCDSWKNQSQTNVGHANSTILINTEKGLDIWNRIKVGLVVASMNLGEEVLVNTTLNHPTEMPIIRKTIYSDIYDKGWGAFEKKNSFLSLLKKCIIKIMG